MRAGPRYGPPYTVKSPSLRPIPCFDRTLQRRRPDALFRHRSRLDSRKDHTSIFLPRFLVGFLQEVTSHLFRVRTAVHHGGDRAATWIVFGLLFFFCFGFWFLLCSCRFFFS